MTDTTNLSSRVDQAGQDLDEALISGAPERIDAACQKFEEACDEQDGLNEENLALINRLGIQICDVPGYLRIVMDQGTITVLITRPEAAQKIPHVFEGMPVKTRLAN